MIPDLIGTEPVTEIMHGTEVLDRYRWLEDSKSSLTIAWLAKRRDNYEKYFAKTPHLPLIRQRVKDYLDIEVVDQAARTTKGLIYRCRKPGAEQPSIYSSDRFGGREELLVESSRSDPFSSLSICRVSNDGNMVAVGFRDGGADARSLKVYEVSGRTMLPFELPPGTIRGLAFAPNGEGIFYCHDQVPPSAEHVVRFHSFGRPAGDDSIVFRVRRTTHSRLLLISDDSQVGIVHRHESGSRLIIDFYVATYNRSPNWRRVLSNTQPPASPLLTGGRIFLLTGTNGSPVSISELSIEGKHIRTILPEPQVPIAQVEVTNDAFYAALSVDQMRYLHRWALNEERVDILDTPKTDAIKLHSPLNSASHSLFFTCESFTRPPCLMECQSTLDIRRLSADQEPSSRHHSALSRQIYEAKDRVGVRITVLSPSENRTSPAPTLLSAYGGFGVAMAPQYSVLANILVESGARFAVPNIRGGSENGPGWHEAGRGRNRQTAFDDFIAAAEWLLQQQIAAPQRLGICGGSNGGLLVGAAMTQRPDLFKAVLCIGPILDMVRYEKFDNAKRWKNEFGTIDCADDFFAMLSYSPYHNVRENVDYPATLFVTGAMDERCNPSHALKMAARLEDRKTQRSPILMDYSPKRGHTPALPLSTRVEALSTRLAFLFTELHIASPRAS